MDTHTHKLLCLISSPGYCWQVSKHDPSTHSRSYFKENYEERSQQCSLPQNYFKEATLSIVTLIYWNDFSFLSLFLKNPVPVVVNVFKSRQFLTKKYLSHDHALFFVTGLDISTNGKNKFNTTNMLIWRVNISLMISRWSSNRMYLSGSANTAQN